jgi:hypothetical protein
MPEISARVSFSFIIPRTLSKPRWLRLKRTISRAASRWAGVMSSNSKPWRMIGRVLFAHRRHSGASMGN